MIKRRLPGKPIEDEDDDENEDDTQPLRRPS
jgi:hypothetical protein